MNILLTGATGFVGGALAEFLDSHPLFDLTCAVRRPPSECHDRNIFIGRLDTASDWTSPLAGQHVVIHLAARAHILNDEVPDPLAEYRKVNVEGTLTLARKAFEVGVKRFVYISSIKVNGERTAEGRAFRADDAPLPEDPYGISKMEAELGLQRLAAETGLEVVIIRPPLVYGPGVKGNFASMVKLVRKGLPLPLGDVHNKRSLVALDNLIDLIVTCIDHPSASNQVFLAGDGEDVSTTELLRGIARAMGRRPRLVPVPPGLLILCASVLGKKAVAQRLLGSLQVDISKTRDLLGWRPPVSLEEGLAKAVKD